ncbi:response regulator [Hathewaya histolytica]|uniref:Stage 0 sporulation protein A homolog n=1 Tax=Hathewaya histolytica TaxID=1498 RepID=A0A4U9R0L0_HATHI|nr:response regulator [Hathewaya histolytica]VTQ84682.1 ethanolamine utilization response regulator [Hathewaya histolytica]
MNKRIVIADDEPITRMDLREMLETAGYSVVGEASDGFDAIELCRKHKPDLILMDIKMPLLDGINACKRINEDELCDSIILLTAYSDKTFIDRAKEVGVIGYLVKPIDDRALLPALEIALSKGKEFKNVKKEAKTANDKLEARKVIEKAKGIIMKERNTDEEKAYSYLRELSMNKRTSMKEISEIIIMSSDTEM